MSAAIIACTGAKLITLNTFKNSEKENNNEEK